MFHIITLYISLDIRTGFFGYLFKFFWFFGLPVRIRLITLRVRICFVPPYKIHSGIFYISDRVRIEFFGSDLGLWILCQSLVMPIITNDSHGRHWLYNQSVIFARGPWIGCLWNQRFIFSYFCFVNESSLWLYTQIELMWY